MKRKVVVATRNLKKLKEIKRLFRSSGISVLSLERYPDIPEIVEDGKTFRDNAVKKALAVSRYVDGLVVADDSGLEVAALQGLPGVRSSRFAGPKKDDRLNILKLLRTLGGLPPSKRGARFRCVVAIARSGRIVKVVEGACVGQIGSKMEGSSGFGYDPVFIPRGYKKTIASLGSAVKDTLSHRAKAFRKARKVIAVYFSKGPSSVF